MDSPLNSVCGKNSSKWPTLQKPSAPTSYLSWLSTPRTLTISAACSRCDMDVSSRKRKHRFSLFVIVLPLYVWMIPSCGLLHIFLPVIILPAFAWQCFINLLQPTGHVMHHQFNIQQLYALPTLYLCVLYLSENKERLVSLLRTLIGFYNRDERCLQRGTDWVFK